MVTQDRNSLQQCVATWVSDSGLLSFAAGVFDSKPWSEVPRIPDGELDARLAEEGRLAGEARP